MYKFDVGFLRLTKIVICFSTTNKRKGRIDENINFKNYAEQDEFRKL